MNHEKMLHIILTIVFKIVETMAANYNSGVKAFTIKWLHERTGIDFSDVYDSAFHAAADYE